MAGREIENDSANLRRTVRRLIDAGRVNSAMKRVLDDGRVIVPSAESLEALKQKHLPASSTAIIGVPQNAQPLVLERSSIERAIRSMSVASAAGPDGLFVSHLKQMLGADAGAAKESFITSLYAFSSACTAGRMPQQIARFFFGASLIALRKKDGGIRPIAVGCVLRRVIAKAACSLLREQAANLLCPRQLGIGVSDGATAAAHAARRFLSSCKENEGILKLDFKNAFNTVDRSHMLTAVYTHFPELAHFTFSSYGTASYLFHGSQHIESAQGVQQGDPLGPLLFSISTFEVTSTPYCRFAVWYLDDGSIGGSAREVLASLDRVAESCASIGLELNITK